MEVVTKNNAVTMTHLGYANLVGTVCGENCVHQMEPTSVLMTDRKWNEDAIRVEKERITAHTHTQLRFDWK